jgi:putative ABC transport system permease protein
VLTALLAAGIAIRATFAAPTVEALRPVGLAREEHGEIWLPMVLAAALLGTSWLVALAPPGLGYSGLVTAVVAACCAVYAAGAVSAPALVLICGALTARFGRYSPSLPARLAAANLPRNPGRSGATVATIAVAMAIAVNVTGMVASFNNAFLGWIEQHFAPDLLVGAGGRMQLLVGTRLPDTLGAQLREVPGIAAVEPFRAAPIRLGDRTVYLQGIALDERLAHGGLPMVEGTLEEAAPALRAGTGVLLSDNLAYRLGLHQGDELSVPTPTGPRRFRIEGVYIDYLGSLDLGAIAVAYPELARTWGDHDVNLFRLWTMAGTSPTTARRAVLDRLGAGKGYYVLTASQFLDAIRAQVRGFFLATWALQVIAAIVGVIGVVNAQLATVLDRSAEISVLRTIGFTTRDLTRSVLVECGALGIIGALSGVAIGTMVSLQIVTVALRLVTGWRIPFTLPLGPLLAGVAAAALVSAVAGWVPARAASRLTAWQQSVD